MNKKLGIALVLATAAILTMTTIVNAAYTYSEETTMLNEVEFQHTGIYHWTGNDAKSLAKSIAVNYSRDESPDEYCQEDELKTYMRRVYEKPREELDETEKIFIDGIRGEILAVDCDYGRWKGYGAIEEDIEITCTETINWELEDKEEHVYTRVGLNSSDVVSFTVSEGWIISSVEDLKGSSFSSDKRTVSGLAIADEAYVIKFTKVPASSSTPTPIVTPTPSLTPTPIVTPTPMLTPTPTTPGFEAIIAISGLLAVAYGVLRRRR